MASLIWLALAGVLLLVELAVPGFGGFLMASVAALVLASLAGLALAPGLQWILFVGLTAAGNLVLWRWSRRQRPTRPLQSSQADLAEVIEGFGGADGAPGQDGSLGRVRWQGQSWAAENLGPSSALAPGTRVTVMGREGTRLQVMP
ncbi:NfeD family protein [Vulcanococcus limneticus Candia 3F8]|uniref:NfeD family protein n=1 Tax=Vulcanococcus limneticus TaxID=2170428 RepID=UPI000B97FD17|nr:NfeD family protein [Vulcanococcus limneticus]MCP9791062.1 NfeD family protein [Vulcanococcus limneticus MW73D5]MCP9892286.1 NfeD family protein [Vulcanococcus limneticus Candia 3F8]MCP9895892.1 NfeD family protein [Vulcanococcus limneticus Candia 3B3]